MSTELFLNVEHRLSRQQLFKIKECFGRNGVENITFRYAGKVLNSEGENYYFDSMWTPFLKPLNEFKNPRVENHSGLNSIFETVKEIIGYLLGENLGVKLFFASVEDNAFPYKGQVMLRFSDLDEFRSFEWGIVYEISK